MGFFRKHAWAGAEKQMITSIVGAEMQLAGDIAFKGKLRLDGKVEGNIRGDYLILGETGVVLGDIAVNTFVCSGRVEGNVNVRKLSVAKSGHIQGKVESMDLAVESGAVLHGEIKSRSQQELRLVPGSALPDEEWEGRTQEAGLRKQGKKSQLA